MSEWRSVYMPHMGRYHPDFDPKAEYEFSRFDDESGVETYRLADRSEWFNLTGLRWRRRDCASEHVASGERA